MSKNYPFFNQTEPVQSIRLLPVQKKVILASEGYLRIRFCDMRIARDFQGTTRLIPVLHTGYDLQGYKETIVSASSNKDVKADLRQVHLGYHTILPISPYNGQSIKLSLRLYALPFADLASEMLIVLGSLAKFLPDPRLNAAIGISDVIRSGFNALLKVDGTKQVLAWEGEIGGGRELRQHYIFVTIDKKTLKPEFFEFRDNILLFNEERLRHQHYFVIAVEVARFRDDWQILPEIESAWQSWQQMRIEYNVSNERYNQVTEALRIALRAAVPTKLNFAQVRYIEEKLIYPIRDDEMGKLIYRGEEETPVQSSEGSSLFEDADLFNNENTDFVDEGVDN